MEKKSRFKKLLTTASAFAVIAGASTSAMGDNRNIIADNATFNDGANLNQTAGADVPVNDGDEVTYSGDFSASSGAVKRNLIIHTGNHNPLMFTVDFATGFKAVTTTGGGLLPVTIDNAIALTLEGGSNLGFAGLGDITFNGAAAALTIDTDATLGGAIDGAAADNGVITLNANKKVTFNGVIGGVNRLADINILAGGEATFNQDVSVHFNGGNNGVKLTGADSKITIAAGKTLGANVISVGGAGNGQIEFLGAGTVTGQIGNANAVKSVKIGSGAVVFQDIVKAQSLLVTHANSDARLTKNFTGNVEFSNNGQVSVAAGKAITGHVATTNNHQGKLVFAGNGIVTGNIGANGNSLTSVEVTGAGKLQLTKANGAHYADSFIFKNNAAEIEVAAGGKLNGNAVANAANNGVITFTGAGEFHGTLGHGANTLAKVESKAAVVKIGAGDHKVTQFAVANVAAAGFEFADGANITGKISAAGANGGVVEFKGNSTVSGVVGDGNDLTSITISGGADKVVALSAAARAANTNITNGGTLQLKDAATLTTGAGAGVVNFTTANGGTLQISSNINHALAVGITQAGSYGSVVVDNAANNANTKTIRLGQVGDSNTAEALKELKLDSAATVRVDAGSHITTLDIQNENAVLEFHNGGNAGVYKIENINLNGDKFGTLKISADTTLKTAENGVSFGSGEKKLKALTFANGTTLTLEDKVNIFADSVTNAVANGTITTEGDSTIDLGNQANALDALNVGGANKTTKLLSALSFNGNATIGNDATLEITKNFTTADIRGANDGNGTVKFSNAEEITVTGAVGNGGVNKLKTIKFAGKDVKFAQGAANAMNHAGGEFIFSGDEAIKVTFNNHGGTNIATGTKFTNTSSNDVTHTVVLKAGPNVANTGNAGTEFTGDLSSANNGAKKINFELSTGVDAALSGAVKADGANFTTSVNNAGDLILHAANVVVNSVGDTHAALHQVSFDESGAIKNGTVAQAAAVADAKIATLGGNIIITNFDLNGAASQVKFNDGAIININNINSGGNAANSKGIVEYAGNATHNGNLGNVASILKTVTFSDNADKKVVLNTEEIWSENTSFRKGEVALKDNLTVNGTHLYANNSNITLADKTLTVASTDFHLAGHNTIKLTATADKNNSLSGGHIVIGGVTNINVVNSTSLEIIPTITLPKRLKDGTELEFMIIDNNSADGLKIDDIKIAAAKSHYEFNAEMNGKDLIGRAVVNVEGNIRKNLEKLDANDSENLVTWLKAADGTEASKVADLLFALTDRNGDAGFDKARELIDRINPNATITDAVENSLGLVGSGLGQRMDNLAGSSAAVTVSSLETGVAAGDDQHRYGVWASPFYNNTTQKARKGGAGYKSESFGATFGFDTRANDDMIIGTALTLASSDVKHKDFKSGDKTKINSYMFSIYGMQQLTDNWFLHGVATYGTNEVKNTEKRVSGLTTYEFVNGKYTANAFNAETTFGYNFVTNDVTLTPMFGARFTRVNDGGYKETGSQTGQNLTVHTKASNKFEVIAGAKVSGYSFETNGIVLHPEVHGFVNHDLIGKNGTPKVGQDGAPNGLATKTVKPIRTTYNLGLSINSEYNMMEYGVGYDLDIANKRIGHQGTLKVRVNF